MSLVSLLESAGSIESADIKNLSLTPLKLIESTGSSDVIIINTFVLQSVYGTKPYLYGGKLYLQYGESASNMKFASSQISKGLLVGSTCNKISIVNGQTGNVFDTSDFQGQSIYVSSDSPFTNGDGTLNWYISYYSQSLI